MVKGWKHVVKRYFLDKNASQFTVSQSDLKGILQSRDIENVPISRVVDSKDGHRYGCVIVLDKNISIDKFGGNPTKTMTIFTGEMGNLVTTTPDSCKFITTIPKNEATQ